MWKTKSEPAPAAASSLTSLAVDVLAEVLRTLGDHPVEVPELDVSEFRETCHAWASHVLVGSAPPGGQPVASGRRDWEGIRRFVTEHRHREHAVVHKSMADFRHVVGAFVESINQALVEDQETDREVMVHLERLRSVVGTYSTEDIKREALTVVGSLSAVMERRRERARRRMEDLGKQVSTLGQRLQEARRENAVDPLTQLFNRRALDDALLRTLQIESTFGQAACLLLVDVDHFKNVNDSYGHPAGDAVLRALADAVCRCFPRKGDLVARYGGEEFAVVLADATSKEGVMLAQRLLQAVRAMAVDHGGQRICITVSVGVAQARPGDSVVAWLERADQALYRAKRGGRDRAETAEV